MFSVDAVNFSQTLQSLEGEQQRVHGIILPWDLRIYEMYSLPESDRILFIASKEIDGLPEDKAIDCIIGEIDIVDPHVLLCSRFW